MREWALILPPTGTAAAVVILLVSDGVSVQDWGTVTPSVYLAILSAIANSMLGFALSEGLALVFWRTALSGCTVRGIILQMSFADRI